jgi:hypothetical protein
VIRADETSLFHEDGAIYDIVGVTGKETDTVHLILSGH